MIQLMRLFMFGEIKNFTVARIVDTNSILITCSNDVEIIFDFIDDADLTESLYLYGFELDGAPYA